MAYDPTIYRGSARHYVPGRPGYSPELESTLADAVGLDGVGRLLDVGCGPGILALRLARFFRDVTGLDPDPDMLAEARRRAAEQSVDNVRWVQAVAEALPEAAPGPYQLVTFGQSFHWTDQRRMAEAVHDMLEPDGAMVEVFHVVEGRERPAGPGYPPIPHEELRALVARYLGSDRRSGQGQVRERGQSFEEVLAGTRFGPPVTLYAPGIPDLVRDVDSVVSGYFSLTTSAPHLFGDRADDFAHDARRLLLEHSPSGLFWDWPGDTAVNLARRRQR